MYLKILRHKKRLSQEQLAECCKLSLRTVQRVEAGHRVGYSSLRALATELGIEVDDLERELYAMRNNTTEFIEVPLSVRILAARPPAWLAMSRRDSLKAERGCIVLAIVVFAASFLIPVKPFPFWGITLHEVSLIGAFLFFFTAYLISISVRVTDKYGDWPAIEASLPRGFFGFGKSKSR